MVVLMRNLLTYASKIRAIPKLASMQMQRFHSLSNRSSMQVSAIDLQHQSLRSSYSVCHSSPGVNLQNRGCVFSDSVQWIKPGSFSHFETPEVYKTEVCAFTKRSFQPSALGFVLLGAAFLLTCQEAKAEEAIDEESERMYNLLHKSPDFRTVEESIELFNYLLRKGEEEVSKAKNKDVVIFFGSTGAGKSTLINFLSGCQMKRDGDHIIVDPKSSIKEIAKIGTTRDSCTFIPRKVSDISISFLNEALIAEDGTPLAKESVLTIYDMPGLDDNRGIEVALANVIVAKKLLKNAKSARLIMVVEKSVITAEKGAGWKGNVELLESTFSRNVGTGEKSLCVMVTKTQNLDKVKRLIKDYTPFGCTNLLPYVKIYDPLNSAHKDILLELVRTTRAYKDLHSNITMNEKQLWKALQLGEKVSEEIIKHLENGDEREVDKAIKKVKFTYGFTTLDNEGLKKPHQVVKNALEKYVAENYITDMSSSNPFPTQIQSFRKYKEFREKFKDSVDFYSSDKKVRKIIQDTPDPRLIALNNPAYTVAGVVSTTAFVALAFLNPLCLLPAVGTGLFTGFAGSHYWSPSQEEKNRSEFYAGI